MSTPLAPGLELAAVVFAVFIGIGNHPDRPQAGRCRRVAGRIAGPATHFQGGYHGVVIGAEEERHGIAFVLRAVDDPMRCGDEFVV